MGLAVNVFFSHKNNNSCKQVTDSVVGRVAGCGEVAASSSCVTWQETEVTSAEDLELSREGEGMQQGIGGGNWLQLSVMSSCNIGSPSQR